MSEWALRPSGILHRPRMALTRSEKEVSHEEDITAVRHVAASPSGLAAGRLAERLGAAPNVLTFPLQKHVVAGLVASYREGQLA